jgi:hypothetical protein
VIPTQFAESYKRRPDAKMNWLAVKCQSPSNFDFDFNLSYIHMREELISQPQWKRRRL